MTLPPELRQALAARPGEPLKLVDTQTNAAYYLVSAEQFERLRGLLDDDPSAAYPLADETFAEGWDDPKMADYDRYEEIKKCQ
jgi:hypothetical protein